MAESSTATDTTSQTKCCRHCGGEFPLSDFRRLSRDSSQRVATCRHCRRLLDQARRARKSDSQRDVAIRMMLDAIERTASTRRRTAFLDEALTQLGGPRGFAAELHTVYASTPDVRTKFRVLKMIADTTRDQQAQLRSA